MTVEVEISWNKPHHVKLTHRMKISERNGTGWSDVTRTEHFCSVCGVMLCYGWFKVERAVELCCCYWWWLRFLLSLYALVGVRFIGWLLLYTWLGDIGLDDMLNYVVQLAENCCWIIYPETETNLLSLSSLCQLERFSIAICILKQYLFKQLNISINKLNICSK